MGWMHNLFENEKLVRKDSSTKLESYLGYKPFSCVVDPPSRIVSGNVDTFEQKIARIADGGRQAFRSLSRSKKEVEDSVNIILNGLHDKKLEEQQCCTANCLSIFNVDNTVTGLKKAKDYLQHEILRLNKEIEAVKLKTEEDIATEACRFFRSWASSKIIF